MSIERRRDVRASGEDEPRGLVRELAEERRAGVLTEDLFGPQPAVDPVQVQPGQRLELDEGPRTLVGPGLFGSVVEAHHLQPLRRQDLGVHHGLERAQHVDGWVRHEDDLSLQRIQRGVLETPAAGVISRGPGLVFGGGGESGLAWLLGPDLDLGDLGARAARAWLVAALAARGHERRGEDPESDASRDSSHATICSTSHGCFPTVGPPTTAGCAWLRLAVRDELHISSGRTWGIW